MDTDDLMGEALQLAGLDDMPADSQIHIPGRDLKRVLVGIDIGEAELLLAKQQGFDAAIAHHPSGGSSRVRFHQVLTRHVEMMMAQGVPGEVAWEAVKDLIMEREVSGHASNYDRSPSIARLLGMPFLSIHTPLDEIGRQRMVGSLDSCSEDASIGDAVDALNTMEEFQRAETDIEVRHGGPENPLGRWAVAHGAGTNGGYPVAKAYFSHGVDTLLYIHISPGDLRRLREDASLRGKNLLVTGHIASDSLGINPYVKRLRDLGVEVTCIGGVIEP